MDMVAQREAIVDRRIAGDVARLDRLIDDIRTFWLAVDPEYAHYLEEQRAAILELDERRECE